MNKAVFYDNIRPLFGGRLKQSHVDGMEAVFTAWDRHGDGDLRKLAYIFATAKHETAHRMEPIREYGRGKGKRYGKPHVRTGQTYYGRGYVQLNGLSWFIGLGGWRFCSQIRHNSRGGHRILIIFHVGQRRLGIVCVL